jgi:hypothetical protein
MEIEKQRSRRVKLRREEDRPSEQGERVKEFASVSGLDQSLVSQWGGNKSEPVPGAPLNSQLPSAQSWS